MYKSVILELKWKRGGEVYRNHPVCPFVCPYLESTTSPEQMNRYWWNFSHLLYLTRGCAWSFHTCYTWLEDVHEVFTLAIPDPRMCMKFSHLLYLARGCAWSFHTCYTWHEDVHEVFTLVIPDLRMCMKFSHLLYLTGGCAWSFHTC